MKIVALSDLHGVLPDVEPCDVVCIAGDIAPLRIQSQTIEFTLWMVTEFYPWANNLPCERVLFIAGNHDRVLEAFLKKHQPEEAATMFNYSNEKVVMLHETTYEWRGVKFYGVPVCPDLKQWAFYRDSLMLKEAFEKIPFGIDVLITHCPPRGYNLGQVLQKNVYNFLEDYGCQELHERLLRKPIKQLVICGHVHSGSHIVQKAKDYGCRVVNASIMDEDYKPTYLPIPIEIEHYEK